MIISPIKLHGLRDFFPRKDFRSAKLIQQQSSILEKEKPKSKYILAYIPTRLKIESDLIIRL